MSAYIVCVCVRERERESGSRVVDMYTYMYSLNPAGVSLISLSPCLISLLTYTTRHAISGTTKSTDVSRSLDPTCLKSRESSSSYECT
jgi:hypothetical protein